MELPVESVLLRVFVGEDAQFQHRPLYEAIVLKAREMHLGGTTVLRGHMGFGHSSRIHTTKILRLSQDLPMVIEAVEYTERIEKILPRLDEMVGGGLITLEKVHVILYRSKK